MATQFDDFDAQLQCEDVQGNYIPTDQDLLDMEVAFAFNAEILEESKIKDLADFF